MRGLAVFYFVGGCGWPCAVFLQRLPTHFVMREPISTHSNALRIIAGLSGVQLRCLNVHCSEFDDYSLPGCDPELWVLKQVQHDTGGEEPLEIID